MTATISFRTGGPEDEFINSSWWFDFLERHLEPEQGDLRRTLDENVSVIGVNFSSMTDDEQATVTRWLAAAIEADLSADVVTGQSAEHLERVLTKLRWPRGTRRPTSTPGAELTREYRSAGDGGREELVAALTADDPKDLTAAMVAAAFNLDDWRWLQDTYVALLSHTDSGVRAIAATCLGHVATFRGRLDKDVVVPLVAQLLDDPRTSGFAETALEDISHDIDDSSAEG